MATDKKRAIALGFGFFLLLVVGFFGGRSLKQNLSRMQVKQIQLALGAGVGATAIGTIYFGYRLIKPEPEYDVYEEYEEPTQL